MTFSGKMKKKKLLQNLVVSEEPQKGPGVGRGGGRDNLGIPK